MVFCFGILLLTALLSSLLGAALLSCRQELLTVGVTREDKAMLQPDLHRDNGVACAWRRWLVRLPEETPPKPQKRRLLHARCAIRPGGRGKTITLDIDCPHRGVWPMGLEKLRIQDIFGFFALPLFTCRGITKHSLTLTVYPAVVNLIRGTGSAGGKQ